MRAPPSLSGYQIFDTLVPRELCLQLRGRDDLATAVPACVVGGFLPLAFVFSLLSLYSVSLDIDRGFSKWIAEALVVLASPLLSYLLICPHCCSSLEASCSLCLKSCYSPPLCTAYGLLLLLKLLFAYLLFLCNRKDFDPYSLLKLTHTVISSGFQFILVSYSVTGCIH